LHKNDKKSATKLQYEYDATVKKALKKKVKIPCQLVIVTSMMKIMPGPKSIITLAPSARQIHAARTALDWTQTDLCKAAGVGIATIKRLELNHREDDLSRVMQYNTLAKIVGALEHSGIEFTFAEKRRGISFRG
jgi:DNA-binding XRE family transcriptional regulator